MIVNEALRQIGTIAVFVLAINSLIIVRKSLINLNKSDIVFTALILGVWAFSLGLLRAGTHLNLYSISTSSAIFGIISYVTCITQLTLWIPKKKIFNG